MNLKRAAAIALGGGVLAAWLAAAATSSIRVNERPVVVPRPPIDTRGAELDTEIQRLHEHLRPSAAPRQPSRNLFAFSERNPPPAPVAPKAALTEAITVPVAPPTPLKLIGLAEDVGADSTTVRTAIISMNGQVFWVKEGDLVTPRYRTGTITSEVVVLIDLVDNTTLRLAMRP